MSVFIRNYKLGGIYNARIWRFASTTAESTKQGEEEEEFRVLDILKKRDKFQRKVARRAEVPPDRTEKMRTDQKWGNVWPGPRSFHPSSVPLPIRQGYVPKGQAPPGKKANAELMKVPNFLHLTPPVIKTQCEAMKKYCTEWPKLLNNEEAIEKHYPIEIITSDYCHASPTIRNPLSRIVILRIKLADLKLDKHSRDKFLRLVGDRTTCDTYETSRLYHRFGKLILLRRAGKKLSSCSFLKKEEGYNRYNEETDLVTITADRCPIRQQNLDYVNYLLTACYHESWSVEDWEGEKTLSDMEYYDFDLNQSKKNLVNWHLFCYNEEKSLSNDEYKSFDVSSIPNATEYKNAVSALFNDGESDATLKNYDDKVRKLLGLPDKKIVT